MTVVNKADLISYSNSLSSIQSSDSTYGMDMVGVELENFISFSSGHLQGNAWDNVRAKLDAYVTLLYDSCEIIGAILEEADYSVNKLSNYLGEYETLDTSKLTELEEKLRQLNASRGYWNSLLPKLLDVSLDLVDGVAKVPVKPAINKATIMSNIRNIDDSIKELEKLIKKVEGLDNADGSACAGLSGSTPDLNSFSGRVGIL